MTTVRRDDPGAPWPTQGIVPAAEIEARIARVQAALQAHDLDALIAIQRVDLYYLSGTAQRGALFVPADGPPLLLLRKHAGRGRFETPLSHVVDIRSVRQLPEQIAAHSHASLRRVGFELDVLPYNELEFYRGLFPDSAVVDASPLLLAARAIKSPWELDRIAATARISCGTFEYIRQHLRPGLSEMELAGLYECHARTLGNAAGVRVRHHQTEGYPWHVLSGDSGGLVGLMDVPASGAGTSAAFPCGAGDRRIRAGEPIMIDFASVHAGYHMDETRMFAISTMPEPALAAARAAIEIHDDLLQHLRPGAVADDLYRRSVKTARRLGHEQVYGGPVGHQVSFVAHGIGLELMEPPFIAANRADVLEPNMVFAVEPKLVFEGRFSAGVESVVAVTDSGCRLISQTPVEVFIV